MTDRDDKVQPDDEPSVEEPGGEEPAEPAPELTPEEEAELEEAEATEVAPEPDPTELLKKQLADAQARLRAVSKAYNDLQAEMSAFRLRMEARAKNDSELKAFQQVQNFFDPVMNLKRSLQSPGEDMPSFLEGLRMVEHQFLGAMEKLGLQEVPGVGATFDPTIHEALAVTPVQDAAQDGKVLMVYTAGYTVNGRSLQAAQVVIGKYTEPEPEVAPEPKVADAAELPESEEDTEDVPKSVDEGEE